jgi:HD superfamily phosphohydrolase
MSHIGESFFDGEEIKQELRENEIKIETKAALHEMMSVLIGVTVFKDVLDKYDCDIDLFFRLITGAKLDMEGCSKNTPVKEALSSILNSTFDVDKMDFIFRDASSAGVPSLELDLERIINSASLVYDKDDGNKLRLAFGKSGFSVVSTLVDNRNYMFSWIYGHHKVQFHHYVITRYITKLREIYPEFRNFFSYQALVGDCKTDLPILTKVSYVDDHDLLSILKNIALINPELKIFSDSLFKRDPYKPLWKTKIEFDEIKGRFSSKLQYIISCIDSPEFANEFVTGIEGIDDNDIILFKWSSKVVLPSPISNPVYFFLDDLLGGERKIKKYTDLFVASSSGIPSSQISTDEIEKQMFYVFIKKEKFTPKIQTSIINKFSTL